MEKNVNLGLLTVHVPGEAITSADASVTAIGRVAKMLL
jgi:hypothetical protein